MAGLSACATIFNKVYTTSTHICVPPRSPTVDLLLKSPHENSVTLKSDAAGRADKDAATAGAATDAQNKETGNSNRAGKGAQSTCAQDIVGTIAGGLSFHHSTTDPRIGINAIDQQSSFARVSSETNSSRLLAPTSSMGAEGGRDKINGKRPSPSLFINTNVDPGIYTGYTPNVYDESSGASAAAASVVRPVVRDAPRGLYASPSYNRCMQGVSTGSVAGPSALPEAMGGNAGGRGLAGVPPIPPTHRAYQAYGGVGRGGTYGGAGDLSITIPGTSVRRYMHMQLLLALMSAPGLTVAATAEVQWRRLGYYSVDDLYGPAVEPSDSPQSPPQPEAGTADVPSTADIVSPPPPKRQRVNRTSTTHESVVSSGLPNTGAMAMPPSQHSPRTSAMLSGLLVGSESAMLNDAGDLYSSMAPSPHMEMEGIGPMSPYEFPLSFGAESGDSAAGSGGSDESGVRAGDPAQHFDFAAAVGGMESGSQAIMPNFTDSLSLYSPTPVSPTFCGGKLSPLHGALSPQSLSPRVNWATELQGFST